MGFENRDYARDGSYTGGGTFMADAPMCKRILIVTIVVFLGQMFITRPATMEDIQHRIKHIEQQYADNEEFVGCLLYTSPSPRDGLLSRMPSSA